MAQVYRYRVQPLSGSVFDIETPCVLAEGDVLEHDQLLLCISLVAMDESGYDGVIRAETVGRVGLTLRGRVTLS